MRSFFIKEEIRLIQTLVKISLLQTHRNVDITYFCITTITILISSK